MKTLVLAGSGEFTETMVETDNFLIEKLKELKAKVKSKIAIISTAAVPDGLQKNWINDGVRHFEKLGASPFGIDIVNKRDANRKIYAEKLKTSDLIYFSGGHPGFLQRTFADTYAWRTILDLYKTGTILAGSSAGAMIFGNFILANAQESFGKNQKPRWTKGFSLVNYTIFPHFDWVTRQNPKKFRFILESAPQEIRTNWLGIDEDTALIIENTKVIIKGKGKIKQVKRGKEKILDRGENLTL